MEKEEIKKAIKKYLKENLSITINKDGYYNSVTVSLNLEGEEISQDTFYLPSTNEECW